MDDATRSYMRSLKSPFGATRAEESFAVVAPKTKTAIRKWKQRFKHNWKGNIEREKTIKFADDKGRSLINYTDDDRSDLRKTKAADNTRTIKRLLKERGNQRRAIKKEERIADLERRGLSVGRPKDEDDDDSLLTKRDKEICSACLKGSVGAAAGAALGAKIGGPACALACGAYGAVIGVGKSDKKEKEKKKGGKKTRRRRKRRKTRRKSKNTRPRKRKTKHRRKSKNRRKSRRHR